MNALVAGFQIGLEFLETWPRAFELGVRNSDLADALAGASSVGGQQDVSETAEVAQGDLDTSAELQSSVQRLPHDDHLAFGAFGAKHLRVAVVAALYACADIHTYTPTVHYDMLVYLRSSCGEKLAS